MPLTRILLESLIFSHPCAAVVSCTVTPTSAHLPHQVTALQYLSQIRDLVIQRIGKFKLNQDIVGQSIETIECELNQMQTKLEQQFAADSEFQTSTDPEAPSTGRQVLFSKLQELIAIYRSRVSDLRAEHHTISQEEEKGGSIGRRRELQDEISQIRDELYKL